jgi:hypothetical protein
MGSSESQSAPDFHIISLQAERQMQANKMDKGSGIENPVHGNAPLRPGLSPQSASLALRHHSPQGQASASPHILQLQRTYGNRFVQRVVALAQRRQDEREVDPSVESAIERKRGSGSALDHGVRREMESNFGADFRDVRLHTDAEAGALNQAVNAKAFTTGKDLFFSPGAYTPSTSAGRQLLAHELTHVVQQSGSTVQRNLTLGEPEAQYEHEAGAVAGQVANSPRTHLARKGLETADLIQRYTGHFPWGGSNKWYGSPNQFEINGTISGGGSTAAITDTINTMTIRAGTRGDLILELSGKYIGAAGSGLTRSIASGEFRLAGQKFPFKCTPQGALTIEKDAIVPGSPTNDPSHMSPFGIGESEIGLSFAPSSDGSTFVFETVTFVSGGSGASVSLGPVGVPVAGGTTNAHSVGLRINLKVVGAAQGQVTPPGSANPTATAQAETTSVVIMGTPPSATSRKLGEIFFKNEGDITTDPKLLHDIVASLSPDTKRDIRMGHSQVTVNGHASTTGSERLNLERYSKGRAQWAQKQIAPFLSVGAEQIHIGWEGSLSAPPEEQSKVHPGGVPDMHERRVEILLDETTPAKPGAVIVHGSGSATATGGH